MILKIERYIGDGGNWWMLDDIRKISKSLFKKIRFKEEKEGLFDAADIFIVDFYDSLDDKSDQQFRDIIKLICRLSNGDEFCVVFDTTAYLLNDNGKTIEKIVANYKD
ncbi:hypothetical protein KAU51_04875 [Candidatus Parcubacteria bacterium]|jgi:hypothetical protein|nr:hypothetical protein [Candidatus Parcubacteria bacterium]